MGIHVEEGVPFSAPRTRGKCSCVIVQLMSNEWELN